MSTSQPRDADVDRLLRAVLEPSTGSGEAGECPDAETLAAFVENRLSPLERSRLEAHLVGCGRCQETLAILGFETQLEQPAPVRPGWFTWVTAPRLRWIVPVTAAATVAVVFFATRPLIAPGDGVPAADVQVQMARAEPTELAPPGEEQNETTSATLDRGGSAGKGAAGGGTKDEAQQLAAAPQDPAAAAPAGGAAVERGSRTAAAEVSLADRATAAEPGAEVRRTPADAAPAPGARPAPPMAAETETRGKRVASETLAAGAAAQGAVPAPAGLVKSAAPSETPAAPRASIVAFHKPEATGGADAALPVVATPDGAVRWRLGSGGRIWRSDEGGATWREQHTGVEAVLVAGSAPSPDVCWLVGDGGTVLLTTDGTSWRRRPFPFQADLADVRAVDARSAIVTARDGRRFETRDGGLTWR